MVINLSPGPGRKPVFDKEQAVQAALEEGVATFSLRGVADKLGIKPPALYRMFSSRDELQAAAMQKLAEHINDPAVTTTWQDALRLFSSRSWDLFSRYPEAPTVIMTNPEAIIGVLPGFRRLIDRLVRLNIPGGFPCASFAVDFIGDITITTFIQMRSFTTTDAAGETPLDRYTTSADDNDDVFGMKDMPGTGFLDSKVEFIIAGIEHGIGPRSSEPEAS